ncbi:DUF1214 domain-containing protein [Mycolicibacterium rhodesiae]|uniref:DUF1214 domain-containing protein n=1 Tax=Mycolicibacterium rhodesiae TaxID=36814 RepID=A0A1X0IXX8_MYCRH|nr:DUF1214 domain-containing protein [Mycolicibacterium rhodesiae]MCV7346908.1 DUF1214 domain-containing protein [Mycolicibacterium rhodesiae]ORB54095.1 hypothetical protein BST42_12085 [Mycolicibacterium rhodesiae]
MFTKTIHKNKVSSRTTAVAATVLSGVVAAVTAAPSASAEAADLQPSVNNVVVAQAQAIGAAGALPYVTATDRSLLPGYVQNVAYSELQLLLAARDLNKPYLLRIGDMLNTAGSEPRTRPLQINPDNVYGYTMLDPNGTYVITGRAGDGTDLNISLQAGLSAANSLPATVANLNINQLQINPDGTYTVTISATPQSGNWLPIANGANAVIVRDTLSNWSATPGSVTIKRVDVPSTPHVIPPALTATETKAILDTIAASLPQDSGHGQQVVGQVFYLPSNTTTPIRESPGAVTGLTAQASVWGTYKLQPGQALILTVPTIEAAYTGAELTDVFTQTLPWQSHQISLSNAQVIPDADGCTRYVISPTDPGVPNWLDSSGYDQGSIVLRWQNYPGALPTGTPTTQVVDVADVRDYLPAGTGMVTPQQRAQQVSLRSAEVGYMLSASKNSTWVTLNLAVDDLKAQLGSSTFDQIFGSQRTPSLLSRLGPESIPALVSQTMMILSDPVQSAIGLAKVLPAAMNEIALPTQLAVARTIKVVSAAVDEATSAARSGQPFGVVQAIEHGISGVTSVARQALFDPATSITAGVLNARDDIAFGLTYAQRTKAAQPRVTSTTPTATRISSASTPRKATATMRPSRSAPAAARGEQAHSARHRVQHNGPAA